MFFVWDLDGVLAETKSRENLVKGSGKDYDEFHKRGLHAGLVGRNAILSRVTSTQGVNIILTGRTENWRYGTEAWLSKNEISYNMLIMREVGNFTPSPDWKLDKIKTLIGADNVAMVFDDRDDIIIKMINNGIPGIKIHE
jgi:hypothetical protein